MQRHEAADRLQPAGHLPMACAMDPIDSAQAHPFFTMAALAGAVALLGTIRDRYHTRRPDLDRVSLVSWGNVSSWALILAIVCLAMGLRHPG